MNGSAPMRCILEAAEQCSSSAKQMAVRELEQLFLWFRTILPEVFSRYTMATYRSDGLQCKVTVFDTRGNSWSVASSKSPTEEDAIRRATKVLQGSRRCADMDLIPRAHLPAVMNCSSSLATRTDRGVMKPGDAFIDENGVRHILPYDFTFIVAAKGRWFGRSLDEVMSTEFPHHTAAYYEEAIKAKRLSLQHRRPDSIGSTIHPGDTIVHIVHRHELPVRSVPAIDILFDGAAASETTSSESYGRDLVVVDKPTGIPVHPCGRYNKNSLLHMLQDAMRIPKLFPCHRLDKDVSGVLVLSRSAAAAGAVNRLFGEDGGIEGAEDSTQVARKRKRTDSDRGQADARTAQSLHRIYIARVSGMFPSSDPRGLQPIAAAFSSAAPELSTPSRRILVDSPIYCDRIHDKKYSCEPFGGSSETAAVPADAKPAATIYTLLHFDAASNESIVLCEPLTGRTHQIRVHLRSLGHPISNDTKYNERASQAQRKIVRSEALVVQSESSARRVVQCDLGTHRGSTADRVAAEFSMCDALCSECSGVLSVQPECDWSIYLHAFRLQLDSAHGLVFQTALPSWVPVSCIAQYTTAKS